MATLVEKKQKLCGIIDGYTGLLDSSGGEYKALKADLLSLRGLIQRERYHIGLIGFMKRGKSTLLNALLGDRNNYNISPVNVLTCTGAIVKYLDNKLYPGAPGKEGAIIYFNDGRNPQHISKEDMPKYVDQTIKGYSKPGEKTIDRIEVYGSYPLIEKRGVIVDSPGMGALHDQDYLAKGILPEVDVILFPVSADLPLEREEEVFLKKLPESEKAKLVFVLTRIDDVDKDEWDKTVAKVQETAATVTGGKADVYKVAAKKVVEAYKEGKTEGEVEKVKQQWGIKEFEDALDAKLRKNSSATEKIRMACTNMERYFSADKEGWLAKKGELSLSSTDLEQKRKNLESFCEITKTAFKKNTRDLEQKWAATVNRFILKLANNETVILNRLNDNLDDKSILSLIGHSSKMARKIHSVLQKELQADLNDLQGQLEDIVSKFNTKLQSDINKDLADKDLADDDLVIRARTPAADGTKGEIPTFIGGGIVVGGGLVGLSTVGGALGSVSSAATALSTAAGVSSSAVASGGIGAKIGLFFGAGGAASAAGGVATAQAALVSALIGAAIPIVGGVAVAMVAYKIGTSFAKARAEKRIPKMIEEQLQGACKSVKESSQEMLDYILTQYNVLLDTILTEKQDELENVIASVKSLDAPAQIQKIEQNLQELDKLSKDLVVLSNAL